MVLLTESEKLAPCGNEQTATDPLCLNLCEQPFTDVPMPFPTPLPFNLETALKDNADDKNLPQMMAPSREPSKSGLPVHDMQDQFDVFINFPWFSPEELVGLTFLCDIGDGEQVHATIVKKILNSHAENHKQIKILVLCNND